MQLSINFNFPKPCLFILLTMFISGAYAGENPRTDYLSLSQGAIPVAIEGLAKELKVGMNHSILVIDGDDGGFAITPKPGGAESQIAFVYELPAMTTFEEFAVPNVLETPSPSQTFFKTIEIAGSDESRDGPFQVIASATLTTHEERGQVTVIPASIKKPVRWVRLSLAGGIDIQRDKTFFEFSEIIGYGSQEATPLSESFNGKWKGRGVLLELKQDGARVSGCYDREGELNGTVSGNILHATGKTRGAGIPSSFVLAVTAAGEIIGVRSSNGAPFKLYNGAAADNITTACSEQSVPLPGCGSIIHGIHFDFDSATIRPESDALLNDLASGLATETAAKVSVIGHTSSEGSDTYNEQLSQRRAEAVVAAIVARGIQSERLLAGGQGEKQPIADNKTEAGRSLNRRVEIVCN